MQELRHQADYDPNARFMHSFVIARVDEAEQVLASLQRVAKHEQLDFITLALGMTRS
jgi:predicted DNA-binding protein with PD1-like motif